MTVVMIIRTTHYRTVLIEDTTITKVNHQNNMNTDHAKILWVYHDRGHEKNALERTLGTGYLKASASGSGASTAKHSKFYTDRYVNHQYQMHTFSPSNPSSSLNRPNRYDNNEGFHVKSKRN